MGARTLQRRGPAAAAARSWRAAPPARRPRLKLRRKYPAADGTRDALLAEKHKYSGHQNSCSQPDPALKTAAAGECRQS